MKTTPEQRKAAESVRRALTKAARAGLSMRVYEGVVLLATEDHLRDPRYGGSGIEMNGWMDEALTVTGGIHADGGAGT